MSFKWCLLLFIIICLFLFVFASQTSATSSDASSDVPLWEVPQGYRRQKTLLRHRDDLCTAKDPCQFVLVADLDKASRVSPDVLQFRSFLFPAKLFVDPTTKKYVIEFQSAPLEITSPMNEGGRGLELSELVLFKGRLLSFDDRTGIVFEYLSNGALVPRHIVTEGDGSSNKGMKIEWATEKDGRLWIGSFGKEFTDPAGLTVKSEANFWVVVLDEFGHIERKDWKPIYNALRDKAEVPFPGYLLHEAVMWSSFLDKWVILPRRVSRDPYDEIKDEKRGSNMIILASKDFSNIQIKRVNAEVVPERGFSSFKFVPGTKDQLILAVKSVEDSDAGIQKSFVSVFSTTTGEVLLADIEVPHSVKYEGVEFIPNEANFPFIKT